MTLRTSISGTNLLWSSAGTWDTGIPVDNDTFLIPVGSSVIFDANHGPTGENFPTGISGTINGSLRASETAGTYYLKLKSGGIVGSGIFQVGESLETKYPANCNFILDLNGANQIMGSSGLVCKFYCQAPSIYYAQIVSGTAKTVQSISLGTTCNIRCDGHGFAAASTTDIVLSNIGETHPLNRLRIKATYVDANNLTAKWYDSGGVIDSTSFPAYTSGGVLSVATATTITDTTIYLDKDVSSWGTGVEVGFANTNRTAASQNVVRTVSTNNGTNIILSVTPGVAYIAGSIVCLITRNIRCINGTSTSGSIAYCHNSNFDLEISGYTPIRVSLGMNFTCGCVRKGNGYLGIESATANSSSITISGGTIYGHSSGLEGVFAYSNITGGNFFGNFYAINLGTHTVSGGFFAGNNITFMAMINSTINSNLLGNAQSCSSLKNCNVSGIFKGESIGFNSCFFSVLSGQIYGSFTGTTGCNRSVINTTNITGSYYGIRYGIYSIIKNVILSSNITDLDRCISAKLSNCKLSVFTEYNSSGYRGINAYCESIDHNQVPNAYKAWTLGGITEKVSDVYPTNKTYSYKHTFESALYPAFRQTTHTVEPGEIITVNYYLYKNAYMSYLPRVQIIDIFSDPLAGGTALSEGIMTDSLNTWETGTLTYQNSTTVPVQVNIRATGMNATGLLYELTEVIRASGLRIFGVRAS